MKHEEAFDSEDPTRRPKSAFFQSHDETGGEETGEDWQDEDAWNAGAEWDEAEPQSEGSDEAEEHVESTEEFAGLFQDDSDDVPAATTRQPEHTGRVDRSARRAGRNAQPTSTGFLWIGLGLTLTLAGAGLGIAGMVAPDALADLSGVMGRLALTPVTVLLVGVLLAQHGANARRVAHLGRDQESGLGRVERHLEELAHRQTDGAGDRDETVALRDSVDRMLIALDRQDEKINNLTRATKMYGKPLIDISKQVSEVANQVAEASERNPDVDGLETRILERMGEQVEAAVGRATAGWEPGELGIDDATAERLADIHAATRRTVGSVDELKALVRQGSDAATGGPDAEELSGRVDEVVARQLELWTKQVTDEVSQRVESLANAPAPTAPPIDLSGLEGSLRQVQAELQRIATRLAQLENSGPARGSGQPAPAPTAAAVGSTPQSAAAPAPNGDGPAAKIAGSSKQKGSNVLGAIAKLRAMKS